MDRVILIYFLCGGTNKNSRHKDSRHKDSRHKDSRHNDSRHKDSRHNDSRHNDCTCTIALTSSFRSRMMGSN